MSGEYDGLVKFGPQKPYSNYSRRKEQIAELDKLFRDVSEFRRSDEYMKLMGFVDKFRGYAPYNAMLLFMQKPGCTFVETAHDWMRKFGRRPKLGARPLVILRTKGPVEFVYDLGDTEIDEALNPERKDFPAELANPFKAEGLFRKSQFTRMIEAMKAEGVTYREEDYGCTCAGMTATVKKSDFYCTPQRTIYYNTYFEVVVDKNLDLTTKVATIFHELGHVLCGHVPSISAHWLPHRGELSKEVREFEAESVCYLVCNRLGIKNPSVEYLHEYCGRNGKTPDISVDSVLKAAGIVEKLANGTHALVPRKELIQHVTRINKDGRKKNGGKKSPR